MAVVDLAFNAWIAEHAGAFPAIFDTRPAVREIALAAFIAGRKAERSTPQEAAPVTGCTCPSGDGSLRWPCPSHTPADESGQGREAPRAVRLAYDALLEEQAAYEEPLFHVDAAVAALEKEYPGIAPETAGRGDSTLREDAARGRAIGAEYDALIRHMDGGGDFYEFQRDAARRARGDSNG